MKILAVILARKGSKRLPNKNKKILIDKPLFLWSVDAAKNINEICDILVSTDDEDIIELSKKNSALAPWKRPSSLCRDDSTSEDALIHALEWYEKNISYVDGVILLQPTSPLRKKETIKKALELFKKKNKPIIGVKKEKVGNENSFYIDENQCLVKFSRSLLLSDRSSFKLNGAIYIINSNDLKTTRKLFNKKTLAFEMSQEESIDIDNIEDFKKAENYLMSNNIEK